MAKKTKLIIASTIIIIIATITIIITSSIGLKTDTNSENVSEITSEAVSEEIAEENVVEETENNIPAPETTKKPVATAEVNRKVIVHENDNDVIEDEVVLCNTNISLDEKADNEKKNHEKAVANAIAESGISSSSTNVEIIYKDEEEKKEPDRVKNTVGSKKQKHQKSLEEVSTTTVDVENNVLVED